MIQLDLTPYFSIKVAAHKSHIGFINEGKTDVMIGHIPKGKYKIRELFFVAKGYTFTIDLKTIILPCEIDELIFTINREKKEEKNATT